MKRYLKRSLCLLSAITLLFNLSACVNTSRPSSDTSKTKVNVVALKGPTGIGIVNLMNDSEQDLTINDYNISIVGDPSEAAAKLASHDVDIALLPTNMSSILYNKTSGAVDIAAINTLGVLYLLSSDGKINSINDLKGKTVYLTGQGATPEFAFSYILKQNGLEPSKDVKLEYKAEHSELATLMISGKVDIGILPEPFVTQVINKNNDIKTALDLTEEWIKVTDSNSVLTMGCIAVRKELEERQKSALDAFLNEYKKSAERANSDVAKTAELCDQYGIMQKEIAEKAIPKCNVVFIDGKEMKDKLFGFLNILFEFEPKSVGGKLPDEDFYYQR
ncbi:MAG: NitT/TauT family transport system substrate-binding protein [Eubacteriales bacterium SKADARSKE-1]|nr:NitT/TauT family transport system substrate-binding protein [Eubacteriales bacterium SKADARSKE-1]